MRRLLKRTAAAVLAAVSLVSLSACSAAETESGSEPRISTEGTAVDDGMAESMIQSAAQTLTLSDEQLIVARALAAEEKDTEQTAFFDEHMAVREELGSLKEIDLEGSSAVLLADGSYTLVIPVTFAEGKMDYVMNLNMTSGMEAEFVAHTTGEAEDTSVSGLLKTATVYAAIGLGTVFIVLVFISLLISCFKFIHAWEQSMKGNGEKPAPAPAPAPVQAAPAPVPVPAAEDLMDDTELVAVITAAITAYEGTPSNGLVVRSIRRVQGPARR
ncbi:MAG: OadG family protein [Clostridiales bacterium]|nr:OadG family protein [Clostridiales bacterium]